MIFNSKIALQRKDNRYMSKRAQVLAQRVAEGHQELIYFIEGCSDADWNTICPKEKWSVGVVIHHVASVLPVEIDLTKVLASGQSITGVTMTEVSQNNAQHAKEYINCNKEETLELLKRNSAMAVSAIQELSDEELDKTATVSLHWDTPLTTQYFIEDHPLSHSYHHMSNIRAALA